MSVLERVREAGGDDGRAVDARAASSERVRRVKRAAKREMMERVGFAEVARIANARDAARSREELRPAIEAVLNAGAGGVVDAPSRSRVVEEILDDVVGLGPLHVFDNV